MHEILFRGQTRRRGEKVNMRGDKLPERWVYGGVLQGTGDHSIIYGGENPDDIEKHTVYTDTLGQYTGLTDKNGVKIFEGDIVEGKDFTADDGYGVIKWEDGAFEVVVDNTVGTFHDNFWGADLEVIGNVHDNPELLGGDDDDT